MSPLCIIVSTICFYNPVFTTIKTGKFPIGVFDKDASYCIQQAKISGSCATQEGETAYRVISEEEFKNAKSREQRSLRYK